MAYEDVYHHAARYGDLVQLQKGSRREFDRPDVHGMTPTLLAAACGQLEALKLMVERGANVNKWDNVGYSALHHAAANGHIGPAAFLVTFGANIWTLDNNFKTALEVASMYDKIEIVSFLDNAAGQQILQNVKAVDKQRHVAVKEADRRLKKHRKLQMQSQGRVDNECLRLARQKHMDVWSKTLPNRSDNHVFGSSFLTDTISRFSLSSNRTSKLRTGTTTGPLANVSTSLPNETVHPVVGRQKINKRVPISNSDFYQSYSDSGFGSTGTDFGHLESGSIFNRPGFGTVAFLDQKFVNGARPLTAQDVTKRTSKYGSVTSESVSTSSQLQVPFSVSTSSCDTTMMPSSVDNFLAAHGLLEYSGVFRKEHINLKAMMLLSEDDIKDLGLPLGPRRVLIDALGQRQTIVRKLELPVRTPLDRLALQSTHL